MLIRFESRRVHSGDKSAQPPLCRECVACIDEATEPAADIISRTRSTELHVTRSAARFRSRSAVAYGQTDECVLVAQQNRVSEILVGNGPDLAAYIQALVYLSCQIGAFVQAGPMELRRNLGKTRPCLAGRRCPTGRDRRAVR